MLIFWGRMRKIREQAQVLFVSWAVEAGLCGIVGLIRFYTAGRWRTVSIRLVMETRYYTLGDVPRVLLGL